MVVVGIINAIVKRRNSLILNLLD